MIQFYDRNGDADSDVTDHPALMAGLFVRKDAQCYEDRLVPSLELADLDEKTFDYCRKLVKVRNNTHLWIKLSNEEILRSCGLMAKDPTTGQIGIKLAALLLFGSDASLASFASSYRIEGIYRNMSFSRFEQNLVEDTTRYDDRVTIRSNLINAYGALMEFVYKHLPEKFYLENGTTQRGDLRSNIFREIVANFCVHREYASQAAGFFEIFSDRVITRNITKFTPSLRTGIISIEELENYTKNPLLVKVFRELGWVEELGSGSRNIKKFAPLYYGKSTIEIMNGENFVFSITYSDADDIAKPESQSATNSVNAAGDSVNITGDSVNAADDSVNLTTLDLVAAEEKLFKLLEERQKSLAKAIKNRMVQELVLIYQAGKLDRVTLLQKLEYTSSQMKGDLRVLQQCGLIEYVHKENIYSLAESIIKELG